MTPRERWTVIAGCAVVVLAAGVRLVPTLRAQLGQRLEAARDRSALATRAEQLVREAPVLQARFAARAPALVALAPQLLGGASAAEGSATLGGELNALAVQHRVLIHTITAVPDTTTGPFTPVQVRLQAEGDLAGLYGFLYDVEHYPLLLSVVRFGLDAEVPTAPVERIRLDAVVRGWMPTEAEGS